MAQGFYNGFRIGYSNCGFGFYAVNVEKDMYLQVDGTLRGDCMTGWFLTYLGTIAAIDKYLSCLESNKKEQRIKERFEKFLADKENIPRDSRTSYLSEITGLKVSECRTRCENFFKFSNGSREIFSCYTYKKAKSFAQGYVAGRNSCS